MRLSALRIIGVKDFEVIRSRGGDYGTGMFVASASVTVIITGRIQPLSGRELLHFEEGDRLTERLKMYSDEELFTVNDSKGLQADVVKVGDKEFVVEKVDSWRWYFKSLLVRKTEPK